MTGVRFTTYVGGRRVFMRGTLLSENEIAATVKGEDGILRRLIRQVVRKR